MNKEDDRNYEITVRTREVLNEIKGFEVASGAPRTGRLIVRFTDRSGKTDDFLMELSPLYSEPSSGMDFDKVVAQNGFMLRSRA